MRHSEYIVLVIVLSLAIGFGAGVWRANSRMDAFCGVLLQGVAAGNSVDSLRIHETAIDSIRNGDTAKAENILRALAAGDAQVIVACKTDAGCSHWAGFEGSHPPDDALIQRA